MEAPWRRGLRLMGLGAVEIDLAYLAPRILAGLLAALGEITLALFSAAAVAEWVFDWPGAAVLFVKSVALPDWGVAALVLLAFAAIKLMADFIGAVSAPQPWRRARWRHERDRRTRIWRRAGPGPGCARPSALPALSVWR